MFKAFSKLWISDKGLVPLSIGCFLAIFILHPMGENFPTVRFIAPAVSTMIVLAGVFSATASNLIRYSTVVITILSLTFRFLSPELPYAIVLDMSISVFFISILILLLMRQVFQTGYVSFHKVLGAVTIYLLLGMVWSFIYSIIEILHPGSFKFSNYNSDFFQINSLLVYYSFTTLTTVGYGDITPVSFIARSFANLEMLVGQLFPAVLLARLVSLEVYFHQKKLDK